MPLVLILLLLPLIEIGLFILVGGRIGIWPVLSLIVLGALAGVLVLRGRMARLPMLLRAGREPAHLLAGGVLTALGAFLLILPGFVTDLLGLILLLPPLQVWLARRVAQAELRGGVRPGERPGPSAEDPASGSVIEGDFSVMDAEAGPDQTGRREPHMPDRLPRTPRGGAPDGSGGPGGPSGH